MADETGGIGRMGENAGGRISRRGVLVAAGLGAAATVVGVNPDRAAAAPGPDAEAEAPRLHKPVVRTERAGAADGPPTVTSADLTFTPHRTLYRGRPERVGLLPDKVADLGPDAARYLGTTPQNPDHPMYAGATVLAAKDGVIVAHTAVGDAVRYTLSGTTVTELPADRRVPARTDTIWDLASMSKLFTATATVQLIEQGRVDLTAPVVRYLPGFAANGKSDILIRHLLTHTSGLIPDPSPSLWQGYRTIPERVQAILTTKPATPPDTKYVYSDLNFLTLGLLVESVSGLTLDRYVHEHITGPLGMRDTCYNPPAALLPRIAATEYEPWANRGLVHGQVHDENAWAMGGVAGHAGVFSTAHDIAILAQTYLNGGRYAGARILSEDSVRLMLTDYNATRFPEDPHGLGWELDLHWYMGALSCPVTFGHTGFTGTTIVVDPVSQSFVVFLSNRVHPSRDWGSNNIARRAMVDDLGLAMPVRPAVGRTEWFAGRVDATTSTLTAPLRRPATDGTLEFKLWYDTEAGYDIAGVSSSTDGKTFTPLPFDLRTDGHHWQTNGTASGYSGRHWLAGSAALPAGTTSVRFSYQTDKEDQGRGVYVDGIRAHGAGGLLFDGESHADAARIVADGWTVTST